MAGLAATLGRCEALLPLGLVPLGLLPLGRLPAHRQARAGLQEGGGAASLLTIPGTRWSSQVQAAFKNFLKPTNSIQCHQIMQNNVQMVLTK
jgi:hypothetical protein